VKEITPFSGSAFPGAHQRLQGWQAVKAIQLRVPAARKRPGLAGSASSKARGRREGRMQAAPPWPACNKKQAAVTTGSATDGGHKPNASSTFYLSTFWPLAEIA